MSRAALDGDEVHEAELGSDELEIINDLLPEGIRVDTCISGHHLEQHELVFGRRALDHSHPRGKNKGGRIDLCANRPDYCCTLSQQSTSHDRCLNVGQAQRVMLRRKSWSRSESTLARCKHHAAAARQF